MSHRDALRYFFFRPNCCTVSVCPPAVIVPMRVPLVVVAATATDTEALPMPFADDSVTHATFDAALQPHEASEAVRVAASIAPVRETVKLDGDNVNVHTGAVTGAASVMTRPWPATDTVAVRGADVPFGPTVIISVLEPVPADAEAVAHG